MNHYPRNIAIGIGLTIIALLLAWFLNWVFERSLPAIALILLAMLVVLLLQRMIWGAIPNPDNPTPQPQRDDPAQPGDVQRETAELPGVDRRYGIMAIPPAGAAILSLLVILIQA